MATTPPSEVLSNGAQRWLRDGVIHRDGDKPAYIDPYGLRMWQCNGVFHRADDKPAVIWGDGSMAWFKRGCFQKDVESSGEVRRRAADVPTRITNFQGYSLRFAFVLNVCQM